MEHPMPVIISLFDLTGQKASAGYLFTRREVRISACIPFLVTGKKNA